jgi:hypothetical protein
MTAILLPDRSAHLRETWNAASASGATRQSVLHEPDGRTSLRSQHMGASVPATDIVDEWGRQSFPASDPPANW